MGFGSIVASVLSLVDKFVPKRKERLQDALHKLEEDLADALARNDAGRIMLVRHRMSILRTRIENLDK